MTLPPNRTARCLLLISEWRLRRWQRWLRANRKLGVAGDSQREQDRATQTFHSLLPGWIVRNCLCLVTLLIAPLPCGYAEQHLTQWHALPKDFQVATRSETSATLQRSNAWAYLQSPDDYANVEVSALVTIESPATQLEFFGSTWSAWPDPKFEDRGSRGDRAPWAILRPIKGCAYGMDAPAMSIAFLPRWSTA